MNEELTLAVLLFIEIVLSEWRLMEAFTIASKFRIMLSNHSRLDYVVIELRDMWTSAHVTPLCISV